MIEADRPIYTSNPEVLKILERKQWKLKPVLYDDGETLYSVIGEGMTLIDSQRLSDIEMALLEWDKL